MNRITEIEAVECLVFKAEIDGREYIGWYRVDEGLSFNMKAPNFHNRPIHSGSKLYEEVNALIKEMETS